MSLSDSSPSNTGQKASPEKARVRKPRSPVLADRPKSQAIGSDASSEKPSDDTSAPSGILTGPDGNQVHWQGYLPGGPPRAILFFVHGLAEHFGRYSFPIEHFRPLGFACYGLDLRGHGKSSGKQVHVSSFEDYGRDVATALGHARERHAATPVYLVGHSMGGIVALRYALDHPEELDGLILSSPGFATHPERQPPLWLAMAGRLASILVPELLFATDIDPALVSRDPKIVQAYSDDPLVSGRVSARWFSAFLAAQKDVFQRADELRMPLLLMQSGADRLVDPDATHRWAELAPPELVSFYTWPEFFHEMFNDPERRRVFELMERWLEDQMATSRR